MIINCFLHNKKPINLLHENLDFFFFGKKKISFGICPKCGHIFQSQTISRRELNIHYKKMQLHIDDLGKPSVQKKRSVQRHLSIIKHEMFNFPKSVLEVSSMNSYNLMQFKKNGAKFVEVLEPNENVAKSLSKEKYIKVHNTKIENVSIKKKYDLIILTHVLEHLFNPLKALKNCYKLQKINQKLLVEVPLFEKVENCPVVTLHHEHLHYFSENTLIELLTRAGYEPDYIEKIYKSTPFPFITIVATKKNKVKVIKSNDFKRQLSSLKNYIYQAKKGWKKINSYLNKFKDDRPTYLFGAGLFTPQFLHYTNVSKKFNIEAIIDSSPIKQKGFIGKYNILKPNLKFLKPKSKIIISSDSCQESIYEFIKKWEKRGFKIITLFKRNKLIKNF